MTNESTGASGEVLAAAAASDNTLPVLPLRDTVLFPQAVLPLAAGREASVRLIEEAARGSREIAVFTQREAGTDQPGQADLHRVGTVAAIHKMLKQPDGTVRQDRKSVV